MRTVLIVLILGLIFAGAVQAQVGTSISADGTPPNTNAMLDVQSPSTGDGKGLLIPRITLEQRTNSSAALAGGLLDNSGNLRGGAAQGLIVYQTDSAQGLYFNTSQTVTPAWVYLGEGGYMTNYLPRTGGSMSGVLNMGAQSITNVSHIDFDGDTVSVGRGANGSFSGSAVGYAAKGTNYGAAVGYQANGSSFGAALGREANGFSAGAALGGYANGSTYGVAMGYTANGYNNGVAVGRDAMGYSNGVAVGRDANGVAYGAALGYMSDGFTYGAALGDSADAANYGAAVGYNSIGTNSGAALGREANGAVFGAAVGYQANGRGGAALGSQANGSSSGAAVGGLAIGTNYGAAVGNQAKGSDYGAAMGREANGAVFGVAVAYKANGSDYGTALGYKANGSKTNVAIGAFANAQGGIERIAIGHNVTNALDNTASIRGHLYLDGGTGVFYRASFGTGGWSTKAFIIAHPLDPENMVLRHFCMEGPQVWNVYAGNAQLVGGSAVVELPEYYYSLNLAGSEVYSLTSVGKAQVWIENKTGNNRFTIGGDRDVEVSWTIKVLRNDPACLEDLRRRPVEQPRKELQPWSPVASPEAGKPGQQGAQNQNVNTFAF